MPVDRVPVVHKFGIISHTQRLALEHRLAKKSLAAEPPRTFSRTRRVPYEVTEDFIAKFNDSNEEDRKELEDFALKMISRAKRRAGILAGGKGDHVDLARSWTELGLLAQCTNRQIQEDSLELLITSLGHAPPTEDQLPSLFYLAKSCLHWLRKCGTNQTCLRTAELKLIRMGHLAFTRLYYHNMVQDLKEYQDEKRSLLQYLSGLQDVKQEEAYKSFPGVLLAVRYIKEVGQLICTGCGEPQQEDSSSIIEPLPEPVRACVESEPESQEEPVAEAAAVEPTEEGRGGLPLLLEEDEEEQGSGDLGFNEAISLSPAAHSPAAASSIHDLSPTLWHALDVWRGVMHRGTGLRLALEGLSTCGTGLTAELWLDVCCAFQVLTEVSKHEIAVLRTFQALAAGIFSGPAEMAAAHARHIHLCNHCLSAMTGHQSLHDKDNLNFDHEKHRSPSEFLSLGKTPSLVRGLRDFADLGLEDKQVTHAEDVDESIASRDSLSDTSSEASFADVSSVESGRHGRSGHVNARSSSNMSKTKKKRRRSTEARKSESSSESESEIEKPQKTQIKNSKQTDIPKKESDGPGRARGGTAVRFNVQEPEVSNTEGGVPVARVERSFTKDSLYTQGSSVTLPLADEDDRSSTKTGTSQHSSAPGLNGWRWELAYLYTDCMTSVCMNGQSSIIQKTALLGSEANRKVTVYGKRNTMSREGLGLLDLLKLRFPSEQDPMLARKDWSWRVRFAAVQGLVRICRQSAGDSTKDGIRGVAWNQLMRHHSQERDVRVLEAWKLAQIESDLDNKLPSIDLVNSSFSSWAASNLSAVLLPPLPPVVPHTSSGRASRSRPRAHATPLNKPAPAVKMGPKRPSLRQEILLPQLLVNLRLTIAAE